MTDYDESKVSPRPWKLECDPDHEGNPNGWNCLGYYIDDANGEYVHKYSLSDEDMRFVVHCVNEHDTLKRHSGWMKQVFDHILPSWTIHSVDIPKKVIAEHDRLKARIDELNKIVETMEENLQVLEGTNDRLKALEPLVKDLVEIAKAYLVFHGRSLMGPSRKSIEQTIAKARAVLEATEPCAECNGQGLVPVHPDESPGGEDTCPACKGEGQI